MGIPRQPKTEASRQTRSWGLLATGGASLGGVGATLIARIVVHAPAADAVALCVLSGFPIVAWACIAAMKIRADERVEITRIQAEESVDIIKVQANAIVAIARAQAARTPEALREERRAEAMRRVTDPVRALKLDTAHEIARGGPSNARVVKDVMPLMHESAGPAEALSAPSPGPETNEGGDIIKPPSDEQIEQMLSGTASDPDVDGLISAQARRFLRLQPENRSKFIFNLIQSIYE